MIDKVQKIKEWVRTRKLCTMDEHMKFYSDAAEAEYNALCKVEEIIDSLQEEPVSKVWHDASEEPKPNMELICVGQYGNPFVLSSNSNSFKSRDISKWAYFNDLINLSKVEKTVKNWNEPVSEDLEEVSKNYALNNTLWDDCKDEIQESFKAGAKWQKEQFEKNRLKHCNSITNEQAELEQGFIDQHLDKYQRMPTFLDAIEYGMRLQKEQMMNGAVEVQVNNDPLVGRYINMSSSVVLDTLNQLNSDKAKLIIIKED